MELDIKVYSDVSENAQRLLNRYEFLVEILNQAVPKIKELFGAKTHVELEYSDGEVFAYIGTKLKPKEALATLSRFDEEWWFDVLPKVDCMLNFGLRYL